MKKFYLVLAAAAMSLSSLAQPILCGHRGSNYGVESTEEAFRNGAALGYEYLETDIKRTTDGHFVLIHDNDLSRFGSSIAVETSTLAQLKAVTMTQTRLGTTYTGTICTLDEMLDICNELNVKPLLELKWTPGINSNDCSKIPELIALIESKGFRNKCIILTSMKPCLEYIRTNYPDITLQFLTGEYWANHFEWCKTWRIDADIQAGYFDKNTVKKYHAEGLYVNMWTTNDEAGYRTYGNMGCDFITTDRLDGHNLPELNPDITFPPNNVDYPEINAEVKGSYPIGDMTAFFPFTAGEGMKVQRAICDGELWYVLSTNEAGTEAQLNTISVTDGTVTTMSLEGVTGGTKPLSAIALTSDGKLLGCNTAKVAYAGGNETWKLYMWDSPTATPTTVLEIDETPALGNWNNGIAGGMLAVTGRAADFKAYTMSYSAAAAAPTYRISGLHVQNGELQKAVYSVDASYTAERMGNPSAVVTPMSRNNLLFYSNVLTPTEFTFEWDGERLPMSIYSEMDAEPAMYISGSNVAYLRYGSTPYLVMPCKDESGALVPVVYNVADGLDKMTAAGVGPAGQLTANEAYIAAGAKVRGNHDASLYIFAEGQGIATWSMDDVPPLPDPVKLNLTLERKWINSNSTGNKPEHIDGTNAQQGTAWNGYFYVNDCSDKLIYIFDESGCIGSIPGGAGWGCATDDAGNIVVRNDKLTGTEHQFIVYPAGAMPDSYGTPVTIDVVVPLDGQTNFINASGDLLDGTGHIYLYPNKQNAVNLITIERGEFVEAVASRSIALTGSTAGYVIPWGDDLQNWIYHVRASGFYFYHAGDSESLLVTRASTTAPSRNSTGGGAYFMIGGNRLMLHNCGANYKGGFAVRDLSMGTVYASVDPIGTLGYETGGNYSTFNWLFVEQKGAYDFTVYQYCPSNGMAVYRLYDPTKVETGVADVKAGAAQLDVTLRGQTLRVALPGGEAPAKVTLIDAAGRTVRTAAQATMNVNGLSHGIYVVVANGLTAKIVL